MLSFLGLKKSNNLHRALDFGLSGQGFESLRGHDYLKTPSFLKRFFYMLN